MKRDGQNVFSIMFQNVKNMYLLFVFLSYVFLLYLKMSSYHFLESFLGPRSKRGAFHKHDRCREKVGKKQKERGVKKRLRGG